MLFLPHYDQVKTRQQHWDVEDKAPNHTNDPPKNMSNTLDLCHNLEPSLRTSTVSDSLTFMKICELQLDFFLQTAWFYCGLIDVTVRVR